MKAYIYFMSLVLSVILLFVGLIIWEPLLFTPCIAYFLSGIICLYIFMFDDPDNNPDSDRQE